MLITVTGRCTMTLNVKKWRDKGEFFRVDRYRDTGRCIALQVAGPSRCLSYQIMPPGRKHQGRVTKTKTAIKQEVQSE